MFGLQCLDSSGRVFFDTTAKRHYHCIGKLVSRVYPYSIVNVEDNYVRVPAAYKGEDYLFVMKAQDRVTSYYGDVIPRGLTFTGTDLQIVMGGRSNVRDQFGKGATEIYVYYRGPVASHTPGAFGITTHDNNSQLSFSSSDQSRVLQITSTFSVRNGLSNRNLGVRDVGVLIGSQPATVFASSEGYAVVQGIGLYISAQTREMIVANMSVGRSWFPGGFQKTALHLSFVKLPDNVPVLPWTGI